ncbi:MAG: hypothetical protein R3B82_06970 [Sandaracinaceae bacterium]
MGAPWWSTRRPSTRRSRPAWAGAVLLGALALLPHPARAQSMEEALAAFQRGDVEAAQTQFEAVLRRGSGQPALVAAVHRHLGILHAILGEDDAAQRAFERSLAIEPDQTVPEEISPPQQDYFRTAQRVRRGRPLELVIDRPDERSLRGRATDAPDALVARVRVHVAGLGWEHTSEDGAPIAIPEERAHDHLRVELTALDADGNVLASRSHELAPIALPEAPPASDDGVWIGLGVGLGAAVLVAAAITAAILLAPQDGFASPRVEWP